MFTDSEPARECHLATGAHFIAAGSASGSQTGSQYVVSPKTEPDKIFGISHRAYLTTLAVVVTVVVAVASFIVLALLSGASTFGSSSPLG